MKFGLEIRILHDEKDVNVSELVKQSELAKAVLSAPEKLEGALVPVTNGKPAMDAFYDPLLPLLESWMLKMPWCLAGDTETVFLKNSEHAFGFEPVSEALQLSFYVGQGNEVEEYVLEPVALALENFCDVSIQAVKQLLTLIGQVKPGADQAGDVKTLKEATLEADKSLREYRNQR
jgi:hypothetical protein